jgi:uncharacterized membrane protein
VGSSLIAAFYRPSVGYDGAMSERLTISALAVAMILGTVAIHYLFGGSSLPGAFAVASAAVMSGVLCYYGFLYVRRRK